MTSFSSSQSPPSTAPLTLSLSLSLPSSFVFPPSSASSLTVSLLIFSQLPQSDGEELWKPEGGQESLTKKPSNAHAQTHTVSTSKLPSFSAYWQARSLGSEDGERVVGDEVREREGRRLNVKQTEHCCCRNALIFVWLGVAMCVCATQGFTGYSCCTESDVYFLSWHSQQPLRPACGIWNLPASAL